MKNNTSNTIRVLHYIGSLNTGGSQTMIMEIYRKIDKSLVQFDFVVDRKEELLYSDEIKKLGGKVYIFDEYYKGINHHKYIKQWKDFFKQHKEYKIIHCHVRSVGKIVLKTAKMNGLETIIHSHSTSNGKGIKAIAKRFFQFNICKYSDYFFACSRQSAEWLYGKKKSQSNKCYIINNSIDSSKYKYNPIIRKKLRNELKVENKIVIGQVGRLVYIKNHDFSLKVLMECLKINPNFCLMIVGDGELKSNLLEKINNMGLEKNVLMLGNKTNVNELMQAMDIFIMPSLFEGLPLSLIEAQAASLPCVISNNVIDGILIPDLVKKIELEKSEKKWADLINKEYSKKRKNTSEVIKKNNFDSEINSKWLCNFYQEIYKEVDNNVLN